MNGATLWGTRVVVSPWVRPGEVVVMGNFVKPAGWERMTNAQRVEYAIARGAIVIVQNLDDIR